MLTLAVCSAAEAGLLSKSVKGAKEAFSHFGDDTVRIGEKSRNAINGVDEAHESPKTLIAEPKGNGVSDWFSQRTPGDTVGTTRFIDNPPAKLPNASNFSDQASLAAFWKWYLGLKSVSSLGKAWENEFWDEAERIIEQESLADEVIIVNEQGIPTFNYLINPIILELDDVETKDEYTSGLADLFSLLAVSGRAGGLDPSKFLDFKKLGSSEPIDLVSFSASTAAFYVERDDQAMALTFSNYLKRDASDFFERDSFRSQLFAPLACVSLLFTIDQIQYGVLPGSEDVFNLHCQKDSLEAKVLSALETIDTQLKGVQSEASKKDALQQLKVIAALERALIYGLFGDEVNYYQARSDIFESIRSGIPSSDLITSTFGLLALTEASLGNFGNSYRFAKETMRFGASEPEILGDMTTFLVGLFAYNQDYTRMKDLILIQQTIAHPSSRYFIPAKSKLRLAESLLILESYLHELDRL